MKHIKRLVLLVITCLFFMTHLSALTFVKQDESGNVINDAEFELKTSRGEFLKKITVDPIVQNPKSGIVPETGDALGGNILGEGKYTIDYTFETYEDLLKLFTDEQKAILSKFDTVEHFNTIKDKITMTDTLSYCTNKTEYVNWYKESKGIKIVDYNLTDGENNSKYIRILVETGAYLDEVKTPVGLEKETIIIGMTVIIDYFVELDGTITLDEYFPHFEYLFKYDESIDYTNLSDFYNKMTDSLVYGNNCNQLTVFYNCDVAPAISNGENTSSLPTVGPTSCNQVVIDKTSTENLSEKVSIKTFINGKEKTTLEKNSENTITILSSNEARTPLYNSVFKSVIPTGLRYVASSASNDGVYDEATNTITWNYGYFDALYSVKLTYKVTVPNDASDNEVYKVNSTLSSSSLTLPVTSSDATADLTTKNVDENPDTGDVRELLILCTLAISFGILMVIMKKRSINSI